MKKRTILKLSVAGYIVSHLMACQPVDNKFTGGSGTQNLGSSTETPSAGLPPITSLAPEVPADCATFLRKPPVIDMNATADKEIIGTTGALVYPDAFRNVHVESYSGSVDIHSAIHANVASRTGKVRINAQTIQSASIDSGELCIRANLIEFTDADLSSGTQVLAANTIKTIRLGSAPFHIYRATVHKLERPSTGSAGYNGQICLHDGAKILNYGEYSPTIARSNCN